MDATAPHATAPAVAAFDLDGTLTEGGSVVRWLSDVAGGPRVRRSIAANAAGLLAGAIRSGTVADEAKERLFVASLAGLDADDVTAASVAFADAHLRSKVRPEVAERLAAHLALGHVVVVVSASPALYVRRIAQDLGAHGSASTELEVEHGRLTGRYEGANCRGEEKLRRVRALLSDLGAPETGPARPLYAYGNSRGDLRLLAAADRPVDVSRLGRFGRLRGFPRLAAVALERR